MQLVLIEHESLDIKKNMSTLSDTFDQMNGATTDTQHDVAIIKPSPNSDISTVNETKLSETHEDIDENNGTAKVNGDLQMNDVQKDVNLVRESNKDNYENKSTVHGKTDCSLNIDNLVESPFIAKENTSAENEYTQLDQSKDKTCEYRNANENEEVTNGLESQSSKNDTVESRFENFSVLVDEKVLESEELDISASDVDETCKETSFSPYCDEKDFNISEQFLLFNKDKSMEDDENVSSNAKFTADRDNKSVNKEIEVKHTEKVVFKPTENNDVDIAQNQELTKFQSQSMNINVIKNADDLSKGHTEKYNLNIHDKEPCEISSVGDRTLNTLAKNETLVEKPLENETNNDKMDQKMSNVDITDIAEGNSSEVAENISEAENSIESQTNNNDVEQELAIDGIINNITADEKTSKLAENIHAAEMYVETNTRNNEAIQELAFDCIIDNITADGETETTKLAENIPVVENSVETGTNKNDATQELAFDSIINNVTANEKTSEHYENILEAKKSVETKTYSNEMTQELNNDGIVEQSSEIKKASKVRVNMETDANCDTVEIGQEFSKEEDTDKVSVEHKYITVKKLTDLTDLVLSTDENKEAIGLTETMQNDVMDVDEIDKVSIDVPENNINSENASDKTNQIEPTVSETDIISEDSNENNIKNMHNNTMEVDDVEERPCPEESSHDNVTHKSEINDTKGKEKITQEQNRISVTEKDSETRNSLDAVKEVVSSNVSMSDNASDVSINDNVKGMVSEETKSTDIEFVRDDDIKLVEEECEGKHDKQPEKTLPVVCKLSNTMDILSDDEDSSKPEEQVDSETIKKVEDDSKCINLDDDDDIMFIEDNSQEAYQEQTPVKSIKVESQIVQIPKTNDTNEKESLIKNDKEAPEISEKDDPSVSDLKPNEALKPVESGEEKVLKPLVTKTFLKTVTKGLADMTRSEIEDFCILKLVESIADRSNLNEIKNKMKTMAQTIDDLKKKSQALTKQNRDLHLVVKTVQGDQKKRSLNQMMPMKITRSVGMQVLLSGQSQTQLKKKLPLPPPSPPAPVRSVRNVSSPKTPKPVVNNIPVPRLVPAVSPTTAKSPAAQNNTKPAAVPRNATQQRPEKRPHNKLSPGSSVTVDLTDDEPPAKINLKTPAPPVRLVPSQNLMPKNRPQFSPSSNSPRKVYIPISTNAPNVRPAGTGVMKNFVTPPRPRQPVVRLPNRMNQSMTTNRHPAPLPDAMKQYQPPTWKALPPPPDLKLSKVDDGIVISWKFEGYQPDSYEEVASFQLYAYQETPAPASTALWKKIGDIKALPLPMACTLTQFMSGFKYYFAVRAIDVRSRIGPFSMPGSIMLISKS